MHRGVALLLSKTKGWVGYCTSSGSPSRIGWHISAGCVGVMRWRGTLPPCSRNVVLLPGHPKHTPIGGNTQVGREGEYNEASPRS